MKRKSILFSILIILIVIALWIILIGIPTSMESNEGGNTVVFSDQSYLKQLEGEFTIFDNARVKYSTSGIPSLDGKKPRELHFQIHIIKKRFVNVFSTPSDKYYIGDLVDFKKAFKKELVKRTGDEGLIVKKLTLGYLK